MPPRKRARLSRATTSRSASPSAQTAAATTAHSPTKAPDSPPTIDHLNDPWTDDEEIGLFKGLMQWKPTGIHKHFRLLALHNWLSEHGYIHPRSAHTRPAGIWRKLESMYDLSALDAREDARQLSRMRNPLMAGKGQSGGGESEDEGDEEDEREREEIVVGRRGRKRGREVEVVEEEKEESEENVEEDDDDDDDADAYSVAANKIDEEEFALPTDDGFEDLMWRQRFARRGDDDEEEAEDEDEADSSDLEMPELNLMDDPPLARFTPSFSIEPSVEGETPSRSGRGRRGRPPGRRSIPAEPRRRSARQAEEVEQEEVEDSEEDKEEDEEAEAEEDEEDGDGDSGDEEDEEEEAGSQASTPAPRSRRSLRGSIRGRSTVGSGRGRGRGRPPKR